MQSQIFLDKSEFHTKLQKVFHHNSGEESMHQNARVMIITDQGLTSASAPVQEYVREFFQKTTVLGKDCWVAFIDSVRMNFGSTSHQNQGVAPPDWKRGLRDEIDKFIEGNPTDCFRFSASWDDVCVGPEPD